MSTMKKGTARRAAAKPVRPPAPLAALQPPPTEADIRRRAYELFIERGREDGHDWEDWLAAERELCSNG